MREELKAVKHMLRVKAAEAEHAQHRAEAWEREASQWRAAAEKGKPVPLHNPSSSSSGWGLAFSNAAQQDVRLSIAIATFQLIRVVSPDSACVSMRRERRRGRSQ